MSPKFALFLACLAALNALAATPPLPDGQVSAAVPCALGPGPLTGVQRAALSRGTRFQVITDGVPVRDATPAEIDRLACKGADTSATLNPPRAPNLELLITY